MACGQGPGQSGAAIGRALGDLWMDLRFAARTFRQQPTFVAIAVLTLAMSRWRRLHTFSKLKCADRAGRRQ